MGRLILEVGVRGGRGLGIRIGSRWRSRGLWGFGVLCEFLFPCLLAYSFLPFLHPILCIYIHFSSSCPCSCFVVAPLTKYSILQIIVAVIAFWGMGGVDGKVERDVIDGQAAAEDVEDVVPAYVHEKEADVYVYEDGDAGSFISSDGSSLMKKEKGIEV